jgi:hypothetical protein
MSGFVTLHRKVRDHALFRGDPARLGAWTWLLLTACWKDTPFDIGGKIITLTRGQLCTSRGQLAKAWNWSPSAVERFLARLETEQMIGRATGQGRSVITICNFDKYQDKKAVAGQATGQETGQQSDSDRTAKEQGNKDIPLSNDNGETDFWKFAVAYLGEKKRPLIGKWCSAYGQPDTARAITDAQVARAVEPVAYIEKTLRRQRADADEVPIC